MLPLLHFEELGGAAWGDLLPSGKHVAILDPFLLELLSFSMVLLNPLQVTFSEMFSPFLLGMC